MTSTRFAMVHDADHPVFRSRKGRTTLAVHLWACQHANTNPAATTDRRPVGWVAAGEQRIAGDLGLDRKTVRGHIAALKDGRLWVEWEPRRRSRGLSTEYVVAALAASATVAEADRRAVERAVTPPRTSGVGNRRPIDPVTGRFVANSPAAGDVTAGRPPEPLTGRPAPVITGNTAPNNETLIFETLLNPKAQPRERSAQSADRPSVIPSWADNRAAFTAVNHAVADGHLPMLQLGEQAGLADNLTARGEDPDELVAAFAAAWADEVDEWPEGEPSVADVWMRAFGDGPSEYWSTVEAYAQARRAHRDGSV